MEDEANERDSCARKTAYIVRRILFMTPTLLSIMLVSFAVVQFAPGGPRIDFETREV